MRAAFGGIRMGALASAYPARRRDMVAGLLQASLLTAALLVSAGAHAQAASSYDNLVTEGLSEFDAGRWVEAYNLFKKAHEISPNARTLRGMGMASYELADYPLALRQLTDALDSGDKPLDAEMRDQVHNLVDRAARLVGTLDVTLDPPEAELLVNDELTEERRVVVPVGKVTLRAKLAGYQLEKRVLTVDGGQHYPIELRMLLDVASTEQGPASESEPGLITVGYENPGEDDGLTSSAWFWTGIGAAAVAGVLAAVLIVGGGDDKGSEAFPDGNVGVTWHALEVRR